MKDGQPITKHLTNELRVKKHDPPSATAGPSVPPVSRVGTRASSSSSIGVEPSWFKQFKAKAKKAFCFNSDRAYEAHVAQKKAAARQKAMMREMHLTVSSGSKDVITPEHEWKVEHEGFGASPTFPHHPPTKAKMGSYSSRDVRLTLLPFWHL